MKTIICSIILMISLSGLSQKTNKNVVESFWNENIEAIIKLDKETIIKETNFPLEGSWGYFLELDKNQDEWTEADFTDNIERIFDEETRNKLGQKTINDLVHYNNEAGELIFIINVNFNYPIEGTDEYTESTSIFFFKMFETKWKLYSIEYAG